jgi:choline dehydrogenase
VIDPGYLSEPDDLRLLVEGVALARDIGAAPAFTEWCAEEAYPGPAWSDAAGQRAFVRRAANSFHHPVGTCRMGAVVDKALRVKGVEGLRIVDASVLPGIPAAMTNAAVTAVAEKASDLVLAG